MHRVLSVLGLFSFLPIAAPGANNITGSVRNQSRSVPSAGDEIILVRLDGEMQEEVRTKTDARGTFVLNTQYPDRPHLVRVVHQGVSYDQQASVGQAISLQVFDTSTQVRGIAGTIEILRAGTHGNLLHVSDMVEIKNESRPPLTQASERTFEVYLPANAKIDSVLAACPGKMAVMISPAPVPGEPGHYTLNFPLRPGATKFAFNYDLPYDGHAAFHTRHAYALQQLAVMIPPTMKFSSRSPAFQILTTGNSHYQVQAANQLTAGEGPEFELSGTGALPPIADQASQAGTQSPAALDRMAPAPRPTPLPSFASIDSRLKQAQPPSQSIILGGVIAVLLAVCVLLVWRARKAQNVSSTHSCPTSPSHATVRDPTPSSTPRTLST